MKKSTKLFMSLLSVLTITGNVLAMASCGGFKPADGSESTTTSESVVSPAPEASESVTSTAPEASESTSEAPEVSESTSEAPETSETPSKPSKPQETVAAYDGSKVTVSFYHTMGANLKAILDKHIGKFKEIYPNITIEHQSFGDYPGLRDQITTELAAGNSPSMAYCYPDHVALYNTAKAVMPLDAFIASEAPVTKKGGSTEVMGLTQAQIDDFVPIYYNEGKMFDDGLMYALPMLKSTEVLYYNKTVFAQKGYQVPTTWDEMEALCATIQADPDHKMVIPLGYDSESNWFITMTEQLGTPYTSAVEGQKFLYNTEENHAFVEKFRGWYDNAYVTTEEINGGYTSDMFTATDPNGIRSLMCIGSSAGASYQTPDKLEDGSYPFEVGVAMIPQVDPSNPKIISQGPSLCMFKKSAQEMAATWLFMEYLTTNVQCQAELSMNNGYTCAIQSVVDAKVYKDFLDKADGYGRLQATCILNTIAWKDHYFVSPAFNGSSAARDAVGKLIQTCFLNKPKKGQTMAQFLKEKFDESILGLEQIYGK